MIEEDYFHEVDADQLESESVRSLVDQLKKRYKDRLALLHAGRVRALQGGARFSGVGLAVNEVDRGLRVATVYKRTPAKEAGILPGDVITAVEGRSIAGEDAEAVTARIRGRRGPRSPSRSRAPEAAARRTLTRRQVDIPVVEAKLRETDGQKVGWVNSSPSAARGSTASFASRSSGSTRRAPRDRARSARQRRGVADRGDPGLQPFRPRRDDRLHLGSHSA